MKLLSGVRYRLLRRYSGNALAGALGTALVVGCSVEPPAAPSTNFIISIPVANDSTRVSELVGDRDDFLEIDDVTGGMKLKVTMPLQSADVTAPQILGSAEVGQNLRVTPQSNSFSTAIGDLSIPGQTIPEVEVRMSTLLGREIPTGTIIPLLPGSSFDLEVSLPLANVTSLEIATGGMTISVDNGFPVDIVGLTLTPAGQRRWRGHNRSDRPGDGRRQRRQRRRPVLSGGAHNQRCSGPGRHRRHRRRGGPDRRRGSQPHHQFRTRDAAGNGGDGADSATGIRGQPDPRLPR